MESVLSELQLEFGFVCVFTELEVERGGQGDRREGGGGRSTAATSHIKIRRKEGIYFDQHHQSLWILDLKITLHHQR